MQCKSFLILLRGLILGDHKNKKESSTKAKTLYLDREKVGVRFIENKNKKSLSKNSP